MKKLLEEYTIDKLPSHSDIKPWVRDVKFIEKIAALLHGQEISALGVHRPDLNELRKEYYERNGLSWILDPPGSSGAS